MASGQVENQVGVLRRRFFVPRPKFRSYAELNDEPCRAIGPSDNGECSRTDASPTPRRTNIPDIPDRTIREVFEEERSGLVPYDAPTSGISYAMMVPIGTKWRAHQ